MVVYNTEITGGGGVERRCETLAADWNICTGNKSARLKPKRGAEDAGDGKSISNQ